MATIRSRVAKYETSRDVFGEMARQALANNQTLNRRTQESIAWHKNLARRSRVDATQLTRDDPERLSQRLGVGQMAMYFYDPKTKEELPFYDTFPCVIKIKDQDKNRFLGLNLHYLPVPLRTKFLSALLEYTTNKRYNDRTRFVLTYDLLKSTQKLRFFAPALKSYLKKHVRSQFVIIHPSEWTFAAFLPTQRWNKASQNQVFADTRQKLGVKR